MRLAVAHSHRGLRDYAAPDLRRYTELKNNSQKETGSTRPRLFHRNVRPIIKRSALLLSVVAMVVIMHACSIGYYTQAVGGQLQVLNRREPIPELLADEKTPPDLKTQLELVLEVRDFASQNLDLPDNGSYRSYADLERPYVVWNVFAAPALSVEPVSWCFLIIGCVSYRGYFKEEKAERFAAKLADDGDDVYVAGIAAYSTLGRFADPMLNTMIHWDDANLAAVIFHELAHQKLYVKGDSGFSEAFATVVEEKGVEEWLAATDRADELQAYWNEKTMRGLFARINNEAREQLKTVYASDLDDDAKLTEKARVFDQLKVEYQRIALEQPDFTIYAAYFDRDLNNAHLVSIATYHDLLPPLRCVLTRDAGGDLQRFYELAAVYADLGDREERHEALEALPVCTTLADQQSEAAPAQ